MRKPFIAGNWKMNLDRGSAGALAKAVKQFAETKPSAVGMTIAVFPPFVYLAEIAEALKGSPVLCGAQNCHEAEKGAFTGEISAAMVKNIGATMAILGHSERRHVFGESDERIAKKLRAALAAGLDPILCVGETLAEREAGKTFEVIERQFRLALEGIVAQSFAKVTIAYEPVWAIGTGKTATPKQAAEVHRKLRALAEQAFGKDAAGQLRIQYGGSVTAENAGELFAESEIDGFLVGGASLEAAKFSKILEAGLSRAVRA